MSESSGNSTDAQPPCARPDRISREEFEKITKTTKKIYLLCPLCCTIWGGWCGWGLYGDLWGRHGQHGDELFWWRPISYFILGNRPEQYISRLSSAVRARRLSCWTIEWIVTSLRLSSFRRYPLGGNRQGGALQRGQEGIKGAELCFHLWLCITNYCQIMDTDMDTDHGWCYPFQKMNAMADAFDHLKANPSDFECPGLFQQEIH